MKKDSSDFFRSVQAHICLELERIDGVQKFSIEPWERTDKSGSKGGGGVTRILQNGSVFEQAGVNFSEVEGMLPAEMSFRLVGENQDCPFYATGVSLVIHPLSPLIPTTHANYRYLEVAGRAWFGGGGDLTPYYLFEEDAEHFHRTLKKICDLHDRSYYPAFKKECDQYFFLPHRGETRGVGGIFFDYIGRDDPRDLGEVFQWVKDCANGFLECYIPIVLRRKDSPYTQEQREFQLIRRGRYVEFNLLYDRGTLFGLRTGGRTESILMSLPPLVRWNPEYKIKPGSAEAKLLDTLRQPRSWVS